MMRSAAGLLVCCASALAQCSMCRTVAAAQGDKAGESLNHAILILLLPAIFLFSGFFALAFRLRREDSDEEK